MSGDGGEVGKVAEVAKVALPRGIEPLFPA